MAFLSPRPNGTFVDATLGQAGHARNILELTAPDGRLLAVDADEQAIDSARVSLLAFAGRVTLAHGYFDSIDSIAAASGFSDVQGVLFDLGLSSPQLGDSDRGFSFQKAGPLDMRMGTGVQRTAADLLAESGEADLKHIFQEYGEERYSGRIARQIVLQRKREPIATTDQLSDLIVRSVPRSTSRIHPATRVFQALRIAVNDELGRLEAALPRALSLMAQGARLVVISFHSLEDRIVKQFMQRETRGCICPPNVAQCECGHVPMLRILTRKPVRPSSEEVRRNPRSRSAKLRAAECL